MTNYPRHVWDQLRNKTIQDIAKALEKDGWVREDSRGATIPYRHPERPPDCNRVVLHMHPKATKSPKIMKGLLQRIRWSEDNLVDLKLIKRPSKKRQPKD